MKTNHLNKIRELHQNIRCGAPNAVEDWSAYIRGWNNKIYKKTIVNNLNSDSFRQEVFVPIDTDKYFDDLYMIYNSDNNFMILNEPGKYSFSENVFKRDLQSKGGDPNQLNISISKYEPGKSRIIIRGPKDLHSWERKLYFVELAIRMKELQKTHYLTAWNLSYQGIDMEIYRFHESPISEGKYYVFPARQLSQCPLELEETTFLHFDIISLLLDLADDYHHRNDVYISLSKKFKLRSINLNANNDFEVEIWDEPRVSKAAKGYVKKGYDLKKSITSLHNSFMKSLRESINKYSCSDYTGNNSVFYQQHHIGKWTVSFCWGVSFTMITKCGEVEYAMNFSSKKPNPYPITQYLTKVEEYGNRWNQLTDYCIKEYLKYKRINLIEQNLK